MYQFLQIIDQSKLLTELQKSDAGTLELQNMIEDCLAEIFSVSTMDLLDLCSLAETCTRFRATAHRVMMEKFSRFSFNAHYYVSYGENGYAGHKTYIFQSGPFMYETRKRSEVERVFRSFGMFLSKVSVGNEQFMVDLVEKYCDDQRLKCLKFQSVKISPTLAVNLRPIFRRLHTLTLWGVSIDGDATLFSGLDSLVELNTKFIKNCEKILENVFPKLELFMFRQFETITGLHHLTLKRLLTFIASNTTMKSIDLQLICTEDCWSIILETIASSCKGLQKLAIISSSSTYTCLFPMFEPLNALKSLRTMKLLGVSFYRHVVQIPFMAQLKELYLIDCKMTRDGLADIIRQSVNLVKLETDFILDVRIFNKIVDVVKYRQHVLMLECNSDFTDTRYSKYQKVKLNSS